MYAGQEGKELEGLSDMIRYFLYKQIYPDDDLFDAPLDECPQFRGKIRTHYSARAIYYSPSELSGSGGMHSEVIRSHPSWYNGYERRDTVLVQDGPEDDRMGGILVARIIRLLSFSYNDTFYPCALVEWFIPCGEEPDPITGMWIVKAEISRGKRTREVIHLESIIRACHLIGVYRNDHIPTDFHFSFTHNSFQYFYLNKYIDYHSHESLPS